MYVGSSRFSWQEVAERGSKGRGRILPLSLSNSEPEAELQRKLNLSWSPGTQSASESVEDFSEARGPERGVRLSERRMVKDIEEFGAELEVTRFAKFCLLQHGEDGEVHVAEIRCVDGSAAAIAKRPRGRHGERRRVQPISNGLWMRIRINASNPDAG
jgi:hypothetical protein